VYVAPEKPHTQNVENWHGRCPNARYMPNEHEQLDKKLEKAGEDEEE
jgi:hypothetical protein